jgi:hemerythrin-like domain-containing protein
MGLLEPGRPAALTHQDLKTGDSKLSTTSPIDVRAMAIVHRTFRNAFDESARLVRSAPVPPASRVSFLADHIDFTLAMLHLHHEGEDELLYPKLAERAPDQVPMLAEVENEHALITTAVADVSTACSAWRQHPSAGPAEALAAALEDLNSLCQRHLDDEEQKVVPLAAKTLTQQEWDALGDHAVSHMDRRQKPIAFGMILDPLDEADRAYMKNALPPPVRVLFPLLIERPWRKYASTLRAST